MLKFDIGVMRVAVIEYIFVFKRCSVLMREGKKESNVGLLTRRCALKAGQSVSSENKKYFRFERDSVVLFVALRTEPPFPFREDNFHLHSH